MVDNIWREVLKSATRNLGHTSCLLFSFNGSNVTQAGEVVNEQSRSCKQVYFFFKKSARRIGLFLCAVSFRHLLAFFKDDLMPLNEIFVYQKIGSQP
ncbi:MAG: hypothetical protein IKN27_00790, partial [Selenomonadaceae bacterium]|nr:hypothetical protein [Selenomonadaceae bacterium]